MVSRFIDICVHVYNLFPFPVVSAYLSCLRRGTCPWYVGAQRSSLCTGLGAIVFQLHVKDAFGSASKQRQLTTRVALQM